MPVHGEPERNDMMEYFGELLEGFAFTRFGWVQSYASCCVEPLIIAARELRRRHGRKPTWESGAVTDYWVEE